MSKNKPHLVTFHESILVSLWTFQLTLLVLQKGILYKTCLFVFYGGGVAFLIPVEFWRQVYCKFLNSTSWTFCFSIDKIWILSFLYLWLFCIVNTIFLMHLNLSITICFNINISYISYVQRKAFLSLGIPLFLLYLSIFSTLSLLF